VIVGKLKVRRRTHATIEPETHKLDPRGLSVRSVPRLLGENDAFALGSADGSWYTEHAYRAVSPAGAVRFPTAKAAWDQLTELTGRTRPQGWVIPTGEKRGEVFIITGRDQ
jgi:hypothetical protein